MPKKSLRVGFFVDGYTLKKVNEYYRFFHPYHTRLDFRGLKNWARREAMRLFAPEAKRCNMECHYYHPNKNPLMLGRNAYTVFGLERELRHVGFNVHYSDQVGESGDEPNLNLIEDALLYASFSRMDVAVLLTTQGQFYPFADRLKEYGIRTLLLGWNFSYPKGNRWVRWKTDMNLRESCTYYVAMEQVANRFPPAEENRLGLFQKEHPFSRGRSQAMPVYDPSPLRA